MSYICIPTSVTERQLLRRVIVYWIIGKYYVHNATQILHISLVLYSLGHGLHTLTAVPRLTQPSTLHGMVKWVSAFRLSNNNKWRWWVWLLAAYRRTHSPGRLAWSDDWRPLAAMPYSSYDPGELSQWLCYDDSTINIVVIIIIIYIYIFIHQRTGSKHIYTQYI